MAGTKDRPYRTTDSRWSPDRFLHRELLHAVGRHRLFVAIFVLSGLGLTAAYTAMCRVLYRSTAGVLIENFSRNAISLEDQTVRMNPEVTKAQRILAQSRPVTARMIEINGGPAAASPEGSHDFYLDARVDGQLLYLDVLDEDPERAAKMANAWSQAFVEEMGRRARTGSLRATDFLDKELPKLRNDWIAKQEQLMKFERESSFDLKDFEQHPVRKRFDDLSQKLNAKNTQLAMLEAELEIVENPETSLDVRLQTPRSRGDLLVQLRMRQLQDRKSRLLDARAVYRAGSPEVMAATESLAEAMADLRAAAAEVLSQIRVEEQEVRGERNRLGELFREAEKEFEHLKSKASQHRVLSSEATMAERLYSEMAQKKGQSDISGRFELSYARQWQQAEISSVPARPNWRRNMAIGLVLSLLLAVAASYGLERLDDTIRTGRDLERAMGVDVAGMVPAGPSGMTDEEGFNLVHRQPRSPLADNLRNVHIGLEVTHGSHRTGQPLVITVTSAAPWDGKSFVAANLAALFADLGRKVLFVDGDLRKSSVTRALKRESLPGLREVLTEGSFNRDYALEEPPGYRLLPAGCNPRADTATIRPEQVRSALDQMRPDFDVIILDSPPVLAIADACIFGQLSDVTLVVARSRKTRMAELKRAVGALFAANIRELQIVVNHVDPADATSDQYGYGAAYDYRYGYGYGYGQEASRGRGKSGKGGMGKDSRIAALHGDGDETGGKAEG